MNSVTEVNDETNDDLRDLRQRLRKLRQKQEKKPKLRKSQHRSSTKQEGKASRHGKQNEGAKDRTSTSTGRSDDFLKAKQWVQQREKKREERHRKSKKSSSRRSHRTGEDASRRTRSSRHRGDEPVKHSKKPSRKAHGDSREARPREGERRSSRRHTVDDGEDASLQPRAPKRTSRRSHDVDEDQRPKKPSNSSRSSRNFSTSEEFSMNSSRSRKKNRVRTFEAPEKDVHRSPQSRRKSTTQSRATHIAVDFSEVPELSTHHRASHGEQSYGNGGAAPDERSYENAMGDNDSLIQDDASVCTMDTYWGERYFQLQSQFSAEEAIDMLREEKEIMRELEEERRELQRDMEEAKQQRHMLKQSLSRRNVTGDRFRQMDKNPHRHHDDDATEATWDDRSVTSFASSTARSIVNNIFQRRGVPKSVDLDAASTSKSVSSFSVKKWFPDLQNEVGTEAERAELKMRRSVVHAKDQRDRLSRKLAKQTASNARLLKQLEKMEGVSCDNDSLVDGCDQSHSAWDDNKSVSTLGTTRSFVSAIFHPRVVGEVNR